jgi:hypothetical protein
MSPGLLEIVNGTWFVLGLCLLFVFGRYLMDIGLDFRRQRVQAAGAIFVYFLGESVVRGWTWWWRHKLNHGAAVDWMGWSQVLLGASLLAAMGALAMIRVFTPPGCGHRTWIMSGFIAAAMALALAI